MANLRVNVDDDVLRRARMRALETGACAIPAHP